MFQLSAQVKVSELFLEGMPAPSGVGELHPRFSWRMTGVQRNIKQTGYQIMVASSLQKLQQNRADVWNSGHVISPQSNNVLFPLSILQSCRQYFWKVKVWTNTGTSEWSETSRWSMAILDSTIWRAKWIGSAATRPGDSPYAALPRLSARYLRKEFTIVQKPRRSVAYLSGLGLYELYINGKKVGKDVLAPALTQYDKSVPYHCLDITAYLKPGKNAIGVILGNGRYLPLRYSASGNAVAGTPPSTFFGLPELLFQLQMENETGSSITLCSDTTWKVNVDGPIIANNEFDGEEYDARKEFAGWNSPDFDDSSWPSASLMPPPAGKLVAHFHEGIRVKDTLRPLSVIKTKRNSYILDMGQNMVGWLKIRVRGKAGDSVTMKFSETIVGTDSLYLANIRAAKVTDCYILKGAAEEVWQPRFTYHGFRYAEISGLRDTPQLSDFVGEVVYDDLINIGTLETSNKVINQVYHNAFWSIIGNYRSIPTDCPQRDERMGWLGDRAINSYGESFLFDNSRFYAKWMDDIRDTQTDEGSLPDVAPSYWKVYTDNVSWPITYLIIPDILRRQFDDQLTFRKHYPYMKKWVMYMWNKYQKDSLVLRDTYGDWCLPPESIDIILSKDSSRNTWGALIGAAYFYHGLHLMRNYAAMQDLRGDSLFFDNLANGVRYAFNRKFYHSEQAFYANNTVTSNLLPLAFGLVPEGDQQKVFGNIVERTTGMYDSHVSTGLVGGQWLMRTLAAFGNPQLAFTIATNRTYPSWGYMAEQGATTIWELWNGNTANPSMNSGNHVMLLGDLLVWLYENLVGIRSDDIETGFRKIHMRPFVDAELDMVKATTHSPYGEILSQWSKKEKMISWSVNIPANSCAELFFPVSKADYLKESGLPLAKIKGIRSVKEMEQGIILTLGSGQYQFRWSSAKGRYLQ